jgi:hypothetical protein
VSTGLKRIELSGSEIAKRAGARNEMAIQSSLYLLERAGHIQRVAGGNTEADPPWISKSRSVVAGTANTGTAGVSHAPATIESTRSNPSRRARSIIMLDSIPATQLRINTADVERRAGLERRKLREIIEFCYTEYCYRAHILDYFGDRHHTRQCGSCGNCSPNSALRTPLRPEEIPDDTPAPGRKRTTRTAASGATGTVARRPLRDDENLLVRKTLACASRMKGRFGKNMLAATLRGSAAKNLMQARLNELSTYGLLKGMPQEEILAYIDALCAADCLRVSPGAYPTVSITKLGNLVMREQERIELALPAVVQATDEDDGLLPQTALQTYTLFRNGNSVAEIAAQRGLVINTIEGHLIECMSAGLVVDITTLVSESDRVQIEKAIAEHGTEKLKPIHDSLPESITYNMIRFVVAEIRRVQETK